ncbi:cysteine--tRNA ligase [Gulosibacter bifidus]|uniref:Cysteine--tRNA ligase n=1 Tax=Gulosibacter bifidus TaxID=272239 RepID=A0ABW5RI06_9MICO|nr:cysteine--tRNA ligase [Gulosibacter bifidus]
MTQRLYDTRTQSLVDFAPLRDGEVSMYVCGPTVQSGPHLGHLRSALVYDQMRRWFTYEGLRVTLVRNVTDIDDKTLANATEHEPWWALAYRVEREFGEVYEALRILPPTYEPRATGAIPEMLELIQRLIDRGHAYAAEDGTGDVYFDTASWPEYGALTHQRVADMVDAADGPTRSKRNATDFALWKGQKPGEPDSAAWNSPWGAGRPGWHIECSAMSTKYLGTAFDIHGGGRDLRFPHHENELAQSSAAGDAFASYWIHNGLVSLGGTKMAKSVGNIISATELVRTHRPIVVRYLLGTAHYRSTVEAGDTAYDEAAAAFSRIETFFERAERTLGAVAPASEVPEGFAEHMRDDFAVPQAIAIVHDTVTRGNQALDAGDDAAARTAVSEARAMLDILGLDPVADEWAESTTSDLEPALDALVKDLLQQRATARADKDWAAADRIRDALASAGITIEDTPQGSHWSVN